MAAGGSSTIVSHEDLVRAVDALVDECRATALWFVRTDWYPRNDTERRRVLHDIQKHSDVDVFKRAARLAEWLSRHSSGTSVAS